MTGGELRLRHASKRQGGKWSDDDYDVMSGDVAVGRIYRTVLASNEHDEGIPAMSAQEGQSGRAGRGRRRAESDPERHFATAD
jgi:hypothetical protein